MRPSIWRAGHNRHIGPAPLAAFILSALVGVLSIAPAAAENNGNENNNSHNNNGHPNQGQYNNWQKENHGNQGNYYGNPGNHYGNNNAYRPVYRQPYYYAQPVYVPPPVYYPQWQTPGINLIFPLDLR